MIGSITLHAAIPVRDLEEARKFYGTVLGMHEVDQNQNGIWFQSGTGKIVIYESPYAGTNQATAGVWEVDDPEGMVRSLKGRGITFEHYDDMPGVRRRGDIHLLGQLKAAWFKDPFGNILCIGNTF